MKKQTDQMKRMNYNSSLSLVSIYAHTCSFNQKNMYEHEYLLPAIDLEHNLEGAIHINSNF